MTADLVITEDMIFNMARKYEEFADSSKRIPPELPVSVDAGIATDIIIDILGTLDFAATTFAEKCQGSANNLRLLVAQHKEEEEEVTNYFLNLEEELS